MQIISCVCVVYILINQVFCGLRVERQVSFNFPALGRPQNNPNFGGTQQGGTQSVGGLVDSFLGGFPGKQGGNPNGGNAFISFNNQGGFHNQARDPCQNNGGCEHKCEVLGRRRRCLCNEGFALNDDFITCSDVDECSLEKSYPCQDRCMNTIGSYQCLCGGQAILLPDKRSCGASQPAPAGPASCSVNKGGCQHKCVARRANVRCRCNKGYALDQDGLSCNDVDECATGKNSCPGTCVNTEGSHECSGGAAPTSCNINNGGCEHRCRKNKRGIRCSCNKKFKLNADGKTCERPGKEPQEGQSGGGAKRTCNDNNGGCEQRCRENRKKIVKCSCKRNFALRADGTTCESLTGASRDPCQAVNCHHNCRVVNSQAQCYCNNGFHLQGSRCFEDRPIQIPPAHDIPPVQQPPVQQPPVQQPPVQQPPVQQPPVQQPPVQQPPVQQPPVQQPPMQQPPVQLPPVQQPPVQLPPVQPPPVLPPPVDLPVQLPALPHLPVVTENLNCGINPNKSLFHRIVGGKPAHPEDWPWIAALLLKDAKNNFCGGALIAPQIVVTAAHCVSAFTNTEIRVRLGDYNFDNLEERSPQDFDVQEIRMHEGYDLVTNENDIAIVKLDRPAEAGKHVQTICLPLPTGQYAGKAGIVAGWGTIYFGGPVSAVLQEVTLPVWTEADCTAAYESKIFPGMMCAGVKEGGKDSCQGDSGGPFMMQNPNSYQFFLAGVVSWGIECASPNRPGVYTLVEDFLDWITAHSS